MCYLACFIWHFPRRASVERGSKCLLSSERSSYLPPLYVEHSYHRLTTYFREPGSVYVRGQQRNVEEIGVEGWVMGTVIVDNEQGWHVQVNRVCQSNPAKARFLEDDGSSRRRRRQGGRRSRGTGGRRSRPRSNHDTISFLGEVLLHPERAGKGP